MTEQPTRDAEPPTPDAERPTPDAEPSTPDAEPSTPDAEPFWLVLAREMRAIAQTGLGFTEDRFDRQRYLRLRELAAMIVARGTAAELEPIVDLFKIDSGYATPKIDVRGAAFSDDSVLLVREISDGGWTLPGGWADVNQSAAECVVREVAEESGFVARAVKLAAVYDYRLAGHPQRQLDSIYKMFFLCDITGGTATPSDETSDVAWFALDALPPLSLGRTTAAQIARMYEHHLHPDLPTDFH
jgi:ADP-ribose pyrophosphatase YjhB (NUDIX family)